MRAGQPEIIHLDICACVPLEGGIGQRESGKKGEIWRGRWWTAESIGQLYTVYVHVCVSVWVGLCEEVHDDSWVCLAPLWLKQPAKNCVFSCTAVCLVFLLLSFSLKLNVCVFVSVCVCVRKFPLVLVSAVFAEMWVYLHSACVTLSSV